MLRVLLPGLAAVLLVPSADAWAQRLPKARYKNGASVRRAFRSVVTTARKSTVRVLSRNDAANRDAAEREVALGTIVGSDGWILTKASELDGSLRCRLPGGRKLEARVVGVHRDHDLAMLKVDAADLPAIAWKTSDDPPTGSWLATPGLQVDPVAVGVVSARRRKIPHRRGVLGVSISEAEGGLRITRVVPNSGADEAGLQADDVITHAADSAVKEGPSLSTVLAEFHPGDSLRLRVVREAKSLTLQATLGRPFNQVFSRGNFQNRLGGDLSDRRTGFPAVFQHDGILRPEDCGGVVVDLSGKAVGVNIARAGRAETYALPADEVVPLLKGLKSGRPAPPVFLAETADASSPQPAGK